MCRVIPPPPRPRISWCHSPFCKHRYNFMCALQNRICATEQRATKLINARSSTTVWVTLYTAEFTQGATKSVFDTRCALCNAGYKQTHFRVCKLFPLLQCVVCHTTPSFGYTGCCLFYRTICVQNFDDAVLMSMLKCLIFVLFYVFHLRVFLKYARMVTESPACCCRGRMEVIIMHLLVRLYNIYIYNTIMCINNCPTRCSTKQSIYYSAISVYMFRVSTTPIIRSTQNCNYSLRYWSYFLCSYLPPTWPS